MSVRDGVTGSPNGNGERHEGAGGPLPGRRILIVEDDPYITLALEEMLTEHGFVVAGSARTVDAAMKLAAAVAFDLGLLDVNLGTERIDAVADALAARGRPFVFTSGCGRAGLPEAYSDRPIVEKPFYIEEIIRVLREAFAQHSA